jgi:hypothetical protein
MRDRCYIQRKTDQQTAEHRLCLIRLFVVQTVCYGLAAR